jgi:hypothetical protein
LDVFKEQGFGVQSGAECDGDAVGGTRVANWQLIEDKEQGWR